MGCKKKKERKEEKRREKKEKLRNVLLKIATNKILNLGHQRTISHDTEPEPLFELFRDLVIVKLGHFHVQHLATNI